MSYDSYNYKYSWYFFFFSFISENCHLQLQSYSYDCVSQLLGFIRVNNNEVFRCWYDRPAGYITHYRGINTAILHSMDCTASDVKWFDTSSSSNRDSESPLNPGTVQDFINYFTGLPTGTVLLAITCDEAYIELGSALPMLKTAGVDVNGVGGRGMFAFILQKGYPGKTVLVKNPTSDNCAALGLNVSMKGWFADILYL